MPTMNIRQINGVVRTSEPVWSNLERLAEAASVWFTYDTHNGVYSWVINEAGDTVASITEADIIGPIQISGSGLNNLYNSAEIEYPRSDLNDQPHYATVNLPDDLRNQYEPDNKLQITSEFINNQPQAEYVAMVTLKQSRLDRTVTIVMDYSKINLQAGDIIDITSDTYGWISKEFRIMRVKEIEGDDGSLRLEFSCTEYDDTIYDGTWDNFLVGGAPGIRAIGSIGQPATPTITLTTVNSLPAQTVTTTVPEGVVDRVQFWAGNVLITGNVANTDFNLVGSVASTDANSFTQGANVVFNTTGLTSGTWAWKSRGTNGGGTGPFSNVSANVSYTRNQVPDALLVNTPIVDSSGNVLTGAKPMLSIINGTANVSNKALTTGISSSDYAFLYVTDNFTPPATSNYKLDAVFDTYELTSQTFWDGGRGNLDGGKLDHAAGRFEIKNVSGNVTVATDASGGRGYLGWQDFITTANVILYTGNTYNIRYDYVAYSSHSTPVFNTLIGWNLYTIGNATP